MAWPLISFSPSLERFFWLGWIGLFFLVVGGNVSTLLRITPPPVIERRKERGRNTHYR